MDYSLKNKTRRTKIKFQIEEITNFFFFLQHARISIKFQIDDHAFNS
jgi:hypothetical protein